LSLKKDASLSVSHKDEENGEQRFTEQSIKEENRHNANSFNNIPQNKFNVDLYAENGNKDCKNQVQKMEKATQSDARDIDGKNKQVHQTQTQTSQNDHSVSGGHVIK